jgi:hypothetical protein
VPTPSPSTVRARPGGPCPEAALPLYRLHLMRTGYALMGIGPASLPTPPPGR